MTRPAVEGCTLPEIASITGHELAKMRAIFDRHYLADDPQVAKNAIRKLEPGTDLQDETIVPDEAPSRFSDAGAS